jgi:hypothetical protein
MRSLLVHFDVDVDTVEMIRTRSNSNTIIGSIRTVDDLAVVLSMLWQVNCAQ